MSKADRQTTVACETVIWGQMNVILRFQKIKISRTIFLIEMGDPQKQLWMKMGSHLRADSWDNH